MQKQRLRFRNSITAFVFIVLVGVSLLASSLNVHAAVSTVTVAAEAANPAAQSVYTQFSNQPMLQFTLTSSGNETLDKIKITPTYTGAGAENDYAVWILQDTDGDGLASDGDDPLSDPTILSVGTAVGQIIELTNTALSTGTPLTLLVLGSTVTSDPQNTNTFKIGVQANAVITVEGDDVQSGTVDGNTFTISSSAPSVTISSPAGSASYTNAINAAKGVQLLEFTNATNVGDTIASIGITPSGTIDETTNILVKFYIDDGDQSFSAGLDNLVPASPSLFGANNTLQSFTMDAGVPIPPATVNGGVVRVWVAYALSGGPIADGQTILQTIFTEGDVTLGSGVPVFDETVGLSPLITIDSTAPVVSALSFTPSSGTRKIGETIVLTITADANNYSSSATTVNGVAVTGFTNNGDSTYSATYTVVEGQTDRAAGTIPASVVLIDAAGNTNDAYTTVGANTTAIDAHAPNAPTSIHIESDNADPTKAKSGDTITITATVDAGTTGGAQIGGQDATSVSVDGTTITATRLLNGTETEGSLDFILGSNDSANNSTLVDETDVLDGSFVVTDFTGPTTTVSGVDISADSGSSSSDFITKIASQTITATLSAPLGAGETLVASVVTEGLPSDITAFVSGTSVVWTGVTLVGSDNIQIGVSDETGNYGPIASQAYVLDQTAPTNENSVFTAPDTVSSGATVAVTASSATGGSATDTIWFAPSGTTSFVAGATKTTAAGNATSILAPATAGTYYLYVLDAAGNYSTASTSALTVSSAPTFTAVRTALNTIVLTFSEAVDEPAGETTAWTVAGATVVTVPGVVSGTTMTITTTGLTSTSSTPAVTYDADVGNLLNASLTEMEDNTTANAEDGVAPIFNAIRTALNTIVLDFQETITSGGVDTNSFTVEGASAVSAGVVVDNTITLTTTGLTATDGTPTVTYAAATGDVADTAANEVANGTTADAADGVAPTFTAIRTALNTIILTFSENVTSGGVDTDSFTVEGASAVSASAVTSGNIITLTTTGLTSSSSTPAVTYVAATGDVLDAFVEPNEVVNGTTANAADGVAPTFTAERVDVNTIELTFSEAISSGGVDTNSFTVEGAATVSAGVVGSSIIDDVEVPDREIVLTTTGLTATDGTPAVTYVAATGDVLDAATNEVADGVGANATDGVVPTVVSAVISDVNEITVVYSEAVTSTDTDYSSLVLTAGGARTVTAVSGSGTATIVLTFDGAAAALGETATMNIAGTVVDTSAGTNALAAIVGQAIADGQAPPDPSFGPSAGTFTSSQSVTITSSGSSTIRYTLDETTPSCSTGTLYSGAISVTSTKTVKAIACSATDVASSVASALFTINVTVAGGGGSGGGGAVLPVIATVPIVAAPTPTPTPEPIITPDVTPISVLIQDPTNFEQLLTTFSLTSNPTGFATNKTLVTADAKQFGVTLTTEQVRVISNFVTYGASVETIKLGSGERRALVRDYFETVGRPDIVWDDIQRLTTGQKPVKRNLTKEVAQAGIALDAFKKMTGHAPNFKDASEDVAWNTILYRIRFARDLKVEQEGITEYRSVFKKTPTTPFDWSIVRALGYALK